MSLPSLFIWLFLICKTLGRTSRQRSEVTPEDGSIVRRGEWKLFSRGINPKNTTNVELREGNTREGQEERWSGWGRGVGNRHRELFRER